MDNHYLKCKLCAHKWKSRSSGSNPLMCPKCRSRNWKNPKEVIALSCRRCGYRWKNRNGRIPAKCANSNCKSQYWNRDTPTEQSRRFADSLMKTLQS